MSGKCDVENLKDSLPFWISNHLREKSYMADEINQLLSSPKKDPPSLEGSPSDVTPPPIERKPNTMT